MQPDAPLQGSGSDGFAVEGITAVINDGRIMPRVTVLMPVYNGERDLRESIESVLAQSYRDFEFLIIDDGSTDNSHRIVESYRDDRIVLVANESNIGLARSLNRGLELARGEFVARQDADDVSEPDRLERQVTFLDHHPEIAVLGTWYHKIDEHGALLGSREPPCSPLEIRWRLLLDVPIVHATVLMRKADVTGRVGLYDGTIDYAEDYDYWLRIVRHLNIGNLDQYLVRIRVSSASMTGRYRAMEYIGKIRTTNLKQMFDETQSTGDIGSFDLDVMNKLLIGVPSQLELLDFGKVGRGTLDILRLHDVFCKFHNLDPADARCHRAYVCGEISRRLIDLAHLHFYEDYIGVRRIFFLATRLYWRVTFSRKYLRLLGKLLAGPRVVGTIRGLLKNQRA